MAFYQLNLTGSIFGQATVNTFYYVSSGNPASGENPSQTLVRLFGMQPVTQTGIGAAVLAMVNFAWTATGTFARNIYSNTDFFESVLATPLAGVQLLECLPPFASFGFRSNRVRLNVRRGSKRFAGVSEADTANGTILAASLTRMLAVSNAMSANLTSTELGSSLIFTPAVLAFQRIVEQDGDVVYRKYPESLQLANTAVGVNWARSGNVTTQNTRKFGRGN